MNQEQILAGVCEIIGDVLDRPDIEINAATTAADVEGWDSFNHINIVVAVESRFGVKFNTAEIEEVHNVGELVTLVQQKMK
ncbi:MAG: acyl carrier protein [Steroidobacteraceae bacterium]